MSDFEKLINASDLTEWIMEAYPDWCVGAVRSIVDYVEAMPSAQRTGRWIKADTHNYLFFKNDRIYKCSNCGRLLDFEGVNGGRGDANFCPHCGCAMEGEEE